MARPQPSSDDGRGPLDRVITPNASVRRDGPAQRPALSKSTGLATPLLHFMVGGKVPLFPRKARRNRRAIGASAGGAFGRDKRLRLERTNVPAVVGDLLIAGCSAVNRRHHRITSATTSLRLGVFAPLRFFLSGRVALCLCVALGRRTPFVSSCLRVCDVRGWKFRIQNSEFRIRYASSSKSAARCL